MRQRTIQILFIGVALLCCGALWTQFQAAKVARMRAEATEARGTRLRDELELTTLGNVELSRELTQTAEQVAVHRAEAAHAKQQVEELSARVQRLELGLSAKADTSADTSSAELVAALTKLQSLTASCEERLGALAAGAAERDAAVAGIREAISKDAKTRDACLDTITKSLAALADGAKKQDAAIASLAASAESQQSTATALTQSLTAITESTATQDGALATLTESSKAQDTALAAAAATLTALAEGTKAQDAAIATLTQSLAALAEGDAKRDAALTAVTQSLAALTDTSCKQDAAVAAMALSLTAATTGAETRDAALATTVGELPKGVTAAEVAAQIDASSQKTAAELAKLAEELRAALAGHATSFAELERRIGVLGKMLTVVGARRGPVVADPDPTPTGPLTTTVIKSEPNRGAIAVEVPAAGGLAPGSWLEITRSGRRIATVEVFHVNSAVNLAAARVVSIVPGERIEAGDEARAISAPESAPRGEVPIPSENPRISPALPEASASRPPAPPPRP